ncbi:hypothetical protein [Streptomonospora salina]|uniref:Uncharacterized protein n=1 Tax=Streptomonospora salina TaxID=104205 RepID=A0A841E4H6_9ACTN|nr:hypothetical protein [Streptomonospora salina]MBB5998757.1 hypothetical protein [Streptomonospora salina]
MLISAVRNYVKARVDVVRQRLRENRGDDAGMSTLEIAVIALGLLLAATAVVAAITAAVESRLEGIQ